jgi:two-component system nitrogen regulation sensor histidine kinase GlnL
MEDITAQIVDAQRTGLILLDRSLAVVFANPAAQQILGRSAEQIMALPTADLFATNGAMLATLARALEENQGFTARQINVNRADLSQQMVDCSAIPTSDGLLLELHAIDAQLWLHREDQAARQQQATRELTKGLAHEVKNPLGGIRGATQLLARELDRPELREYTDVILSEVDRLRDLVDRMLGPRAAPEFASTNVHEVLERVISLCSAEFGEPLRFERDYDPSLPALEADRDRLFQACFNIARNAAEALRGAPQPQIWIRTRIARQLTVGRQRHKSVLKIDIEDNGPGIAEELKDRVFFPMISGRAEGTGLGLAMVQTIIGEHHGAIEFDSSPGRTVFTMYLPLTQPATSA